jgi:hypothetical protein
MYMQCCCCTCSVASLHTRFSVSLSASSRGGGDLSRRVSTACAVLPRLCDSRRVSCNRYHSSMVHTINMIPRCAPACQSLAL